MSNDRSRFIAHSGAWLAVGAFALIVATLFRWLAPAVDFVPWIGATFALIPAIIALITILALLILRVVHVREKRRTEHRMAHGRCAYCGYDLRGSDADQCPECGRLIWRPRDPVTGQVIRPEPRS